MTAFSVKEDSTKFGPKTFLKHFTSIISSSQRKLGIKRKAPYIKPNRNIHIGTLHLELLGNDCKLIMLRNFKKTKATPEKCNKVF